MLAWPPQNIPVSNITSVARCFDTNRAVVKRGRDLIPSGVSAQNEAEHADWWRERGGQVPTAAPIPLARIEKRGTPVFPQGLK